MKDLILDFSLDRLLSLPPTEFLAFLLMAAVFTVVVGFLLRLMWELFI